MPAAKNVRYPQKNAKNRKNSRATKVNDELVIIHKININKQ